MFSHGDNSVRSKSNGKLLLVNGLNAVGERGSLSKTASLAVEFLLFLRFVFGLAVLMALTGCETPRPDYVDIMNKAVADRSEPIVLREGDIVKIAFPSKPELNTNQPIRRDGKIFLSWIEGENKEIQAAGLTIADLQKELVKQGITSHLNKPTDVTVTVDFSSFPFYVTGAVLKPGKCISDHSITILEGVMEAGGFDYAKANLSKVTVLRQEDGRIKSTTVNMKKMMNVPDTESFYLKPYDIIYVKEKIPWL